MNLVIEPTEEQVAQLSTTLKPCPFCGSPSRATWTPVPDFRRDAPRGAVGSISWSVECTAVGSRCPMGRHWLCSTSGGAVDAWNRRKDSSPERVAALESELRIIASELTAVQQENLADGIPPPLAINHRLNSVLRVLRGA